MTLGVLFDPRKSPGSVKTDVFSLDFDVMTDEVHEWGNDVTENPVETGAPVADNIQQKADRLTVTGLITDTPIDPDKITQFQGSISGNLFSARLQTHFDMLYSLARLKVPMTVYTRHKVYTDMAMQSCNITRNQTTGEAVPFTLQFVKIRMVNTQTVDVPPGISRKLDKKIDDSTKKKTQPKAEAGKVEPTDVTKKPESKSLAKSLLKSIGGS